MILSFVAGVSFPSLFLLVSIKGGVAVGKYRTSIFQSASLASSSGDLDQRRPPSRFRGFLDVSPTEADRGSLLLLPPFRFRFM